MKPLLESEIPKKFYIHVLASFALGFLLFLWGYGLYAMLSTFKAPRLSYVMLTFTLFFIFFSVFLEHRGVKMPYLLIGGTILSSTFTFVAICIANGVMWIMNNSFPPFDTFLTMVSISTIVAFILIKMAMAKR
jgi:hypothetical protein